MSERLGESRGETERRGLAEQFRVDPKQYPILQKQYELSSAWGNNDKVFWNIDKTASRYVTETAELIGVIDGRMPSRESSEEQKADHVVYLDKSARPVSWLVGTFWDEFSDEKRPENSFLNIDRLPWFNRVMPGMRAGMVEDESGALRRADFNDFMKHADKLPPEVFAGIRALYVTGGIETEDPEEIMKMPTVLDGKDVLVVDEVEESGATLKIAQYLLSRAIPEMKSLNGSYFWHQASKHSHDGTERQQMSVPVWYDAGDSRGRGVGEINRPFFAERHEKFQTPRTRAQKLGSFVLGEIMDLGKEEGGLSRELAREVVQLREDYREGKVLPRVSAHMPNDMVDEIVDKLQEQGVRFAPESDKSPDTFLNVAKAIDARPLEYV